MIERIGFIGDSGSVKLWQWWRQRRWWVRWLSYALAAIVVFYTIENIRGHRALEKAKAEYLAAGYRLDVDEILGPPIPDEENFAAAGIFESENIFASIPSPSSSKSPLTLKHGEVGSEFRASQFFDEDITDADAAQKLLDQLAAKEELISLLHTSALRPKCDWRVRADGGSTVGQNHIEVYFPCMLLHLDAICRIETLDARGAYRSINSKFQIGKWLAYHSSLPQTTVGYAVISLANSEFEEGLSKRLWPRYQLEQFVNSASELFETVTIKSALELHVANSFKAMVDDRKTLVPYDVYFSYVGPLLALPQKFPIREDRIELILNKIIWQTLPRGWHDRMRASCITVAVSRDTKSRAPFFNRLGRSILYPTAEFKVRSSRILKRLELAVIAAELEIHYIDHTTYPDPGDFELPSEHYGYQIGENGRPVLWYSPDAPVTQRLDPSEFETMDYHHLWYYR